MSPTVGSSDRPLRVAVVGSGPAAFFVVEHLLAHTELELSVDILERLPTPFGLVRFGVAPDHQKIKSVTRAFEKVAARPNVRFFGNVDVGRDVMLDDLRAHYDQICFATGAQTDRRLGIPGEDLARSHPATEFVAWYNGHPDFRDLTFDLSVERVAIVGVGNVAVDVARILCRTPEELARTDIADYALEALRESRVREVYMLGRRGPAQAAFTNPEVRELGEMPGADVTVPVDEAALDPLSLEMVEREKDRGTLKKIEILEEFAQRERTDKPRLLTLRFLVSPVEILDDGAGGVGGLKLVRNALRRDGDRLRPVATEEVETLPVQMVFRSVGYHGVPIADLPFHEKRGVVPNLAGRVEGNDGAPVPGIYVAGWIKRGPTGVIGTNKSDAGETVESMLADVAAGVVNRPPHPESEAAAVLISTQCPRRVSYEDWTRLDELEVGRGKAAGRPRVKFTSVEEMLEALDR
ncbi:MAG TPA: FAD-dependent oxidoreductase [Gemmatimonadales bacterium]|nr:FAD-dependent oxidoreductase [Gemmatimonadales bacterium]